MSKKKKVVPSVRELVQYLPEYEAPTVPRYRSDEIIVVNRPLTNSEQRHNDRVVRERLNNG